MQILINPLLSSPLPIKLPLLMPSIVPPFQTPAYLPVAVTSPEIILIADLVLKYRPESNVPVKLPPLIKSIVAICLLLFATDIKPFLPEKLPPVITPTLTGDDPFLPYNTKPEKKGRASGPFGTVTISSSKVGK